MQQKRARVKRHHTWEDEWLVLPTPTLDELIRELEKPLQEAIGFTGALKLMGEGLAERGDDGCALLAVSEAVQERLQAMQDTWLGLIQMRPSYGRSTSSPRDKPRQMARGNRS